MDDWDDDLELYQRLKKRYIDNPSQATATHWAQYVASLRPVDWHQFLDFFMDVPDTFKTPEQLEVTATKKSKNTSILTMQLLHRHSIADPSTASYLQHSDCLHHMHVDTVLSIAQMAWSQSNKTLLAKHLPERLIEFLQTYPSAIEPNVFPKSGVGILLGAILLGADNSSFAVNIGEDEKHYREACKHATLHDVQKLLLCLDKHPQWRRKMQEDYEMPWFEPFMQEDNPHHLSFHIYQSLDPKMNLKQLNHFLTMQTQAPQESYSLESISIS